MEKGAKVLRGFEGVQEELEERVGKLGFELVTAEWAGSPRHPILRLRIDLPEERGSEGGVTVDQCAALSRALEAWLESLDTMPERYVLEVSSPGVERPLTRTRDWTRFAGEQVAVTGSGPLAGRSTRLEGELLGLRQEEAREVVLLRLAGGDEVEVPREEILRAHLVFRWK